MTAMFPVPLPDELLYSVLARYRDRMGFPSQRAVLENTFGRGTLTAVVELPGRIEALLDRLAPGHPYTISDIVWKHTMLPYYARFVAPVRLENALHRMRATGAGGLAEVLGVRATTVPTPTYLQFCRECANSDDSEHGEPYWRRTHQLPGVWVCPQHGSLLWRSAVRRRDPIGRHAFNSLESARSVGAPLSPPADFALLRSLAEDTTWLLSGNAEVEGASALRARYHVTLGARGWMRSYKRVRISDLREAFVGYYSERTLDEFGCLVRSITGQHDWLARLVRKERAAQHPLHHLLLVRFLALSAQDFFAIALPAATATSARPVSGVPCPNLVCSSALGAERIAILGLAEAWRCSRCGFSYRQGVRPGSRPMVLAYGPIWEARLRERVGDPAVSLRAIARELGVSAKTVQQHARRLGAWRAQWSPALKMPSRQRMAALESATATHQAKWLRLLAAHPEEGVQALRSRAPATYTHLYRYARIWLDQHRPARPLAKSRAPRVNWEARDREVATLVTLAAEAMRALPGRPVRLTCAAVARRAGHAALVEQHLDRLPMTAACIRTVTEGRTTFALRKLRWAEETYRAEGVAPAAWEVVRRAALRPDLAAGLVGEVERIAHRLERIHLRAATVAEANHRAEVL